MKYLLFGCLVTISMSFSVPEPITPAAFEQHIQTLSDFVVLLQAHKGNLVSLKQDPAFITLRPSMRVLRKWVKSHQYAFGALQVRVQEIKQHLEHTQSVVEQSTQLGSLVPALRNATQAGVQLADATTELVFALITELKSNKHIKLLLAD